MLTLFRQIYSVLIYFISIICSGRPSINFKNGKRVHIGKILGEGAFSFVYAAYSGKEQYAIKKVFAQSSTFERSVKNEIESFKRFRHVNILEMVDFIEIDNLGRGSIYYLLFPLVKNGSLRDVINIWINNESKRPTLNNILNDFRDICSAINVLHTFTPAYVHQDIKPEVNN